MPQGTKTDRRVERTRRSLLDAFRDLLLERGYDAFAVRDVVERANIGRSTFYEHFESKDEIFRQSLATPVEAIAASTCGDGSVELLRGFMEHFASNLPLVRSIMQSSARRVMSGLLSECIEVYLPERSRDLNGPLSLPKKLVADYLAEGQMGLIDSWINNSLPCSAEALAHALRDATRASIAALWV